MGLDWHARIPSTQKYQEEYIQPCLNIMMKPCSMVGAKRLGDLPDFQERMINQFKRYYQALERLKLQYHGQYEIIPEIQEEITLDQLIEREKSKWHCDTCPLLLELNGASCTDNVFVGMTVHACDSRGKLIAYDDSLDTSIHSEAYQKHNPDQMIKYADVLENALNNLRGTAALKKPSYRQYSKEFDSDPLMYVMKIRKMTANEYSKSLHWREQNLLNAIHWLRTCARHGITMCVSN